MASFVEANSNFVLKLKIEIENGEAQFRRVKLPRIADGNGDVSYNELCGLAVTFVFPDASCPSNYHVMLTYKDVDQDDVIIASNEELLDAVEQFADKGILHITGEVRPKNPNHINHAKPLSQSTIAQTPTKPDETNEPASDIAAAVQAVATAAAAFGGADQNVLESFVGEMANAVINLEKGLAQPAKAASKDVAKTAKQVSRSVTSSVDALSAPLTKKQPTKKPAPKPAPKAKEEAEEQKEEARPFIHGRHTCDGCLCTPVVGPRYHATNIDGYDLCQKCYNNYHGSELTLEPVESHRDAKYQQRWWNKHEARQQRLSRARRPSSGSDSGKKNAKSKNGNANRGDTTPPSATNPATQAKSPTAPPNVHTKDPAPTTEATNASVSLSTEIPNVPTDIETGTPDSLQRADEVQAAEPPPAPEAPKAPAELEMEPQKIVSQEPEPDIVVESPAAPVTKVAPTATLIVDTTTAASAPTVVVVETVDEAASEANTTEAAAADTSAADEKTKVDVHGEVAEDEGVPEVQAEPEPEPSTNEQDVETASSASASIAFIEKSDATTDSNTDQLTNPASSSSEANVSFKEDAVGSGELAEAMGDTFDTVATVIDEMLSDTLGSCADNVEPAADDVSLALSDEEPTLYTGATIVDGAASTVRSSEMFGSVGCEWEVVTTDDCNSDVAGGSGEAADASAATRNDVGAAAIMMGSGSLENDDSTNSDEDDEDSQSSQSEGDDSTTSPTTSSDEDGSEFSMPSSVPSEMSSFASCTTSKVTTDQRTAWQSELSKPDENGPMDEDASAKALERVQAANIGADSDERPSLNGATTWLFGNS